MRSTNNSHGSICGFHITFIARHQLVAKSAKLNAGKDEHEITGCYLHLLEGIKHSTRDKRSLIIQRRSELSLLPLLCYASLHSCFTCYHLTQALCISSEDSSSHTQPLGCLTAVLPLPPPLSMPVLRQAAGVL